MDKCETCRFFNSRAEIANGGECRALPPTVLMVKTPVDGRGQFIQSPLQKQAGITEVPGAFFPLIGADTWCGSYVPVVTQ